MPDMKSVWQTGMNMTEHENIELGAVVQIYDVVVKLSVYQTGQVSDDQSMFCNWYTLIWSSAGTKQQDQIFTHQIIFTSIRE